MKLPFRLKNSKGSIYYGMHFYPGVAEYAELGGIRVFLNEDTIRAMDPSFAGRPVFVLHVDDVEQNVDELRKEADGWVIESFFNAADGKHWAKFIVCSEKGERAVKQGMRLSNCYRPKGSATGGTWNGVSYDKQVTDGEYDHLAIVPNPRYQESVILTPDEFKAYNANKVKELERLANANNEDETPMVLKLFKRAKVENSAELESIIVALPKSGREVAITTLVNEADELAVAKANPVPTPASDDMLVNVGESQMTVGDLVKKYNAAMAELAAPRAPVENEPTDDLANDDEPTDDLANDEEPVDGELNDAKNKNSADAPVAPAAAAAPAAAPAKAGATATDEGKARAEALRNANTRPAPTESVRVDLSVDRVARGKSRYGS